MTVLGLVGGVSQATLDAAVIADYKSNPYVLVVGSDAPAAMIAAVPATRRAGATTSETAIQAALDTGRDVYLYGSFEITTTRLLMTTSGQRLIGMSTGSNQSDEKRTRISVGASFNDSYILECRNSANT